MKNSKNIDRREFIKTCLRFGVGGGLVTTGIFLGTRKNTTTGGSEICENSSPCDGCSQFTGCDLSKAQTAKKIEEAQGGSNGQQ